MSGNKQELVLVLQNTPKSPPPPSPAQPLHTRTRDLLSRETAMQRPTLFAPHPHTFTLYFFCKCNSRTTSQFYVQLPLLYTAWTNATQKSSRKWQLRPFATSCAKDYKGQSLVQTIFDSDGALPWARAVWQPASLVDPLWGTYLLRSSEIKLSSRLQRLLMVVGIPSLLVKMLIVVVAFSKWPFFSLEEHGVSVHLWWLFVVREERKKQTK